MSALRQFLTASLTRTTFDYRTGSVAAYIMGLAVFVLGLRKIAMLPLSEFELFIALLALVGVLLAAICVGLLLEVLCRLETDPRQ